MDRTWKKAGLKYAVLEETDVPSLLVQRVARLRCRKELNNRLLALQLRSWEMSESMGNHDLEVVDASSVD